jgi:hypothetical protein
MSRLLTDIVTEVLSRRVDFELLADLATRDRLAEQLAALGPDIVIVGLFDGEIDEIGALILKTVPAARVLVITSDGRNAFMYEMRPHRSALPDFSLESMVAACVGLEVSAPALRPKD